jgi:hypothetical protein
MADIKSQKLRYANSLASLPKQVLRDILDTVNRSTFSSFKRSFALGELRKSKWQSNFELLLLPMEMQVFKPSILMGKLKQHLPHSVSSDNDPFLAMFYSPATFHAGSSQRRKPQESCGCG